jgi:hypothetical protein
MQRRLQYFDIKWRDKAVDPEELLSVVKVMEVIGALEMTNSKL